MGSERDLHFLSFARCPSHFLTLNVVFVPIAVPVANRVGWQRQKLMRPPPYPRDARPTWPLKSSVPVRDLAQVRDMVANAKKMLAEERATRLLRELDNR
jgi:hypothetical protein